MKIYGKILLATLPLVLMGFLVAGGITYYLSRAALTEIAEQWLETTTSPALETSPCLYVLPASQGNQSAPQQYLLAEVLTS